MTKALTPENALRIGAGRPVHIHGNALAGKSGIVRDNFERQLKEAERLNRMLDGQVKSTEMAIKFFEDELQSTGEQLTINQHGRSLMVSKNESEWRLFVFTRLVADGLAFVPSLVAFGYCIWFSLYGS